MSEEGCSVLEHFVSFLDRRPNLQVLTPHSVLLFLLSNEDRDYAVLAVDILARKLIVYDCLAGRCKETFALPVKRLRSFIKDYFEYASLKLEPSSSGSFQGEGVKDELNLDQVDNWRFEAGVCPKVEAEMVKRYGQGIFILRVLDQLTQCQVPTEEPAEDTFDQVAVELLTG